MFSTVVEVSRRCDHCGCFLFMCQVFTVYGKDLTLYIVFKYWQHYNGICQRVPVWYALDFVQSVFNTRLCFPINRNTQTVLASLVDSLHYSYLFREIETFEKMTYGKRKKQKLQKRLTDTVFFKYWWYSTNSSTVDKAFSHSAIQCSMPPIHHMRKNIKHKRCRGVRGCRWPQLPRVKSRWRPTSVSLLWLLKMPQGTCGLEQTNSS